MDNSMIILIILLRSWLEQVGAIEPINNEKHFTHHRFMNSSNLLIPYVLELMIT